jgi:hypothetical protein
MLTKEDKIRTFEAYIASERFGRDTWTTIHIFGSNVVHGIKVLQLLFVLIGRLDRNSVDISNILKDDVIRIKQQIYLEIILKLVTLIESTLVLVAPPRERICQGNPKHDLLRHQLCQRYSQKICK